MAIKISAHFDAGAIIVLRAESAQAIDLELRKDSCADITQWFYFRLQGARGERCTMRFLNAGNRPIPTDGKTIRRSPVMIARTGFVCRRYLTAMS